MGHVESTIAIPLAAVVMEGEDGRAKARGVATTLADCLVPRADVQALGQGALDPHLEVFHRIAGHRRAGKHPSGGIPSESSSRQMADARRLRFHVKVLCHLLITPKGLWDTRAWSNLMWWSGREPRVVEG